MNSCIYGFNGERLDPVTGMTYLGNGYRPYNPTLMRFTCPDSMSPFDAGGINTYAYCMDDPVNRADPSGHHSVWGWLGIGMGVVLGALLTPVSGGSSLAVVLSAISVTMVVVSTGLAVAQQFVEVSTPKTAAALGWAALGTGIASGLFSGVLSKVAPEAKSLACLLTGTSSRPFGGLMIEGESAGTASISKTPGNTSRGLSFESFAQNHPDDFRLLLTYLPGRDLDRLRATSTTLFREVENHLKDIQAILPVRSLGKIAVVTLNSAEKVEVEDINPLYLLKVREIALGIIPYTTPSQLYRAGINPLSDELMLTHTIDAYEKDIPMEGALGHRGFDTSDIFRDADHADNLFREAWLYQFR